MPITVTLTEREFELIRDAVCSEMECTRDWVDDGSQPQSDLDELDALLDKLDDIAARREAEPK